MAKKKADFRVWIDGDLHAPLTELAKEHASTVPRQANRILRDRFTPMSDLPTAPKGNQWDILKARSFDSDPQLKK